MPRKPTDRSKNGAIVEPNMTPLIDVSLVLVVILMVATPMAFQSGIAVHSTRSSGQKAAEAARTDRVEISIHADGTVGVNQLIVPREALGTALRPILEQSSSRIVVVRCDDRVSHGIFVAVLDEAKGAGAAQIAVVGGTS